MNGNKTTHIGLQGKGGVGKSLAASLNLDYLVRSTGNALGIDTDPVNATLASHASLPVSRLEILNHDNQIDAYQFDQMIETIIAHPGHTVIDNGATSFIPATGYLIETGALDVLTAHGHQVYLHTILVGGQAFDDTLTGLRTLLTQTTAPVIVWENEFFGPVEHDGKRFIQSAIYEKHQSRIAGIVKLPQRNPGTFGRDLALIASRKQTLSDALADSRYTLMQKTRIATMQNEVDQQLQEIYR